jgi:hypothetical protein
MNYIYHWVPKDMQGNILFPLNRLKETHVDVYEKEVDKYTGRENILLQRIPSLNCLWNDVLHLSAVHPSHIKKALIDGGSTKLPDMEFFEIDPHTLNSEDTTVYLYKHSNMANKLKEDNFAQYNPDDIERYSLLPQDTKMYYKEMIVQGKRPLLFHRVPHILFKGSIDVSKIKRISW